jgi:hypothetical protein
VNKSYKTRSIGYKERNSDDKDMKEHIPIGS